MEIHAISKHIINRLYTGQKHGNRELWDSHWVMILVCFCLNVILADLRTVNRGLQVKRSIFAAGFVKERLSVSLTGKEGSDGILK